MNRGGWDDSAEAWIEQVDRGDDLRERVLDRLLIQLTGASRGKQILDFGCGEGRLSRMLKARGANVAGFDYTRRLAHRARQRDSQARVAVADGRRVPFQSASFDQVVTCLVLLDIQEFRSAVREAARVLKPGGIWIDAHIEPFRSASDTPWIRDEKGKRLYVPVENYTQEREVVLSWNGIRIVNYHRPLQSYLAPFLTEGLVLKQLLEPIPDQWSEADEHDFRVPLGLVTVWQKPQ